MVNAYKGVRGHTLSNGLNSGGTDSERLIVRRLTVVLPSPLVYPDSSMPGSPTGVVNCMPVRVRDMADSRDHARPLSTRRTIICGDMHYREKCFLVSSHTRRRCDGAHVR